MCGSLTDGLVYAIRGGDSHHLEQQAWPLSLQGLPWLFSGLQQPYTHSAGKEPDACPSQGTPGQRHRPFALLRRRQKKSEVHAE